MARLFCRMVVVFLFATLPAAARAEAVEWPVSVGPPQSPAPLRYEPAAWKTVPREFLDDAAACFLYSGTIQRLRADEPDAWQTVVHLCTPLVYHRCAGLGVRGADADDVS